MRGLITLWLVASWSVFCGNICVQSNEVDGDHDGSQDDLQKLTKLLEEEELLRTNLKRLDSVVRQMSNSGKDEYSCQGSECSGKNTMCKPQGKSFICECLPGFKPLDEEKKNTKDAVCTEVDYICQGNECIGKNTMCNPQGKTFICECVPGFKPVDEEKKNTKDAVCTASCIPNPCKHGGNCTIPTGDDKVKCSCKQQYDGDKCEIIRWCTNDICKKDEAECKYHDGIDAGYCDCLNQSMQYDYLAKECKLKPFCWNNECGDHQICDFENQKCVCRDGYEMNVNGTCISKVCDPGKCFDDSECSEPVTGTNKCFCSSTQYYTSNKCKDASCLLKSLRDNCKEDCPYGMERKDGTCKQFNGTQEVPCSKDCGNFGYCKTKDGKDFSCICIGEAELKNGTCVLKPSVCPEGVDPLEDKCNCTGKFKSVKNGITCERKTCDDDEVKDECRNAKAICDNNWKDIGGVGYKCVCPDGYVKDDGICTDKCSVKKTQTDCAKDKKVCFLNDDGNNACMCPPGIKENGNKCSDNYEKKSTYIINNLIVSRDEYVKNSELDIVALTKDIIKAMKTTFTNVEFVRLYKYSVNKDGIVCSVWLQFDSERQFDFKRIPLQVFEDDGLLLPKLKLVKDKVAQVKGDNMYLCSGEKDDPFCGATTCKDGKCECPFGYEQDVSSIVDFNGKIMFVCKDINECKVGSHTCNLRSTKCVNTEGSFYCQCLPRYKLRKGFIEEKNKDDCIDICIDPNPCNSGKCSSETGMVDCTCPEGKTGSFCDKEDLALSGARKKTAVVGGILGTLLAVFVIGVVIYIVRQRKSAYSEDFSPPPRMQNSDHSEMTERRPMRGVTNRAYQ